MRLPLALVSVLLAAAAARPARADVVAALGPGPVLHDRVVLIATPEPVVRATLAALRPWSIAVELAGDVPPADDEAAAAIASARQATAVVWLARGELVIYDAIEGTAARRPAAGPIDDVAAASIALSIKTAVRRPPALVAFVAPPEPVPLAAPAHADVAATIEGPPAPGPGRVHVAARAGAGVPLGGDLPATARVAGRVSVVVPRAPGLAVGGGIEVGSAAELHTARFDGTVRDVTLAAGAEWRAALAPRWWLVPAAALTLHHTRLRGTTETGMTPRMVAEHAIAPGLDLEVAVESGGRARLGAAATLTVVAVGERFKVRGEDLPALPGATLGLSIRMSFQ